VQIVELFTYFVSLGVVWVELEVLDRGCWHLLCWNLGGSIIWNVVCMHWYRKGFLLPFSGSVVNLMKNWIHHLKCVCVNPVKEVYCILCSDGKLDEQEDT